MTELSIRKKVVATARQYVGAKKGSALHRKIIDTYNSQKILPRGYAMTMQDPFCAASVTAWSMLAGTYDVIPSECSCSRMIEKAKKLGVWVERDDYVPKLADLCLYDWQDSGNGDCTGAPDHVGIVSAPGAKKFTVIEGNMGKDGHFGERTMQVNGRYIRGFICPRYDMLVEWSMPTVFLPTLEQGDTGGHVSILQQLLVMRGAAIEVDGSYGPLTAAAVRELGRDRADAKAWELLLKKL